MDESKEGMEETSSNLEGPLERLILSSEGEKIVNDTSQTSIDIKASNDDDVHSSL